MANWSSDPRSKPVPDWLRDAVDTVLADLQQATPIELYVGFESSSQTLVFREADDGRVTGFSPYGDESAVQLMVTVADYLQEQLPPETKGAWAEARPECPGHPHPAHAEEIAGEAWWVCLVDRRQIAMIGRLGQDLTAKPKP